MEGDSAFEDPDQWRREIAERRRRRREQDRARRRVFLRRRLTALALLVVLAAVPLLLLGGGGGRGAAPAGEATVEVAAETPKGEVIKPIESRPAELVSGFEEPVPILMYHVIAEAPAGAANPALFVPPAELEQQVRWLARKGYTAVTLSELFDAWYEGAEIPSKPVVLSFDDGTRDQHDAAAPILAAAGWPGVLNLKVASLQQHEMDDEMIGAMLADGWELASHTRTHPDLTTLDAETLRVEVENSRKALSRRFGVPVDFFCYPAGSYDETVLEAVEAAGYRGATTTNPGLATPEQPFELARVRIEPGDGSSGLAAKLAG